MRYSKTLRVAWHIVTCVILAVSLPGCNKDENIGGDSGEKPAIILDNEDGVYTVKVGESLTISPEFENISNAEITWTMDGEVVCRDITWTASWPDIGENYVTIQARNEYGTACEEIRIDVLELTPPVISLAIPDGGLRIEAGTDYTFSPDIQHADMPGFTIKWFVNGLLEGEEKDFIFNRTEIGTYTIKVVASNEDGPSEKEFEVEVIPVGSGAKVFFHGPSYFQPATTRYTFAGRPVFLIPQVENIPSPSYTWEVDGVKSDLHDDMFHFVADKAGEYTVTITVTDNQVLPRAITRNISRGSATAMASVTVVCVDASEKERMRPASGASSPFSNKVFEFLPAPGQFVDETGSPATLTEANAWAEERLKSRRYVSLGAFGGYIIVGFDHSVPASETSYDLVIEGNAFLSDEGGSNEPGIVWVMQDVNGNGLPDDEWYELRGCEYDNKATRQNTYVTYFRPAGPGMNVEWTDADGKRGEVTFLSDLFDKDRVYFPAWITASSYTLYGTMIPARNTYDPSTGFWHNAPYGWGYADNIGSDEIKEGDSYGQYNGFKFSNAVFADGTPVDLEYVDFVKVQTGVQAQSGPVGEISTEVLSFRDMSR